MRMIDADGIELQNSQQPNVKLGFERCKAAVLHAISEVNDGNK